MRLMPMAFALSMAVTGCALPGSRIRETAPAAAASSPAADTPQSPRGENPSEAAALLYQLLQPQELGVTRVFDDGHRSFVLFAGPTPPGLMVFDENGKPLSFTAGAHSVIVEAVRSGLLLRTPTRMSYAQSRAPARLARSDARPGGEGTPWLPADLAAARAEILRTETKLSEAAAALDRAETGDSSVSIPSLNAQLEEIQTSLNGLNATLLRAHFESGSAVLVLTDSVRAALIVAARRADQVRIRGRADPTGTPDINLRIARARALSMRRVLVEGGIEAAKLHTSFSRTDYIATNATPEGRADNRRVDVILVNNTAHHAFVPSAMRERSATVADDWQP